MKPCRHLNYTEGKFTDCEFTDSELVDITDQFPDAGCRIRYWQRGRRWTNAGEGKPRHPQNVQFCGKGRGRINAIFACYNPGEMVCYESETQP